MDKLKIIFVAPLPPPYGGIANWTAMLTRYISTEKVDEIDYRIIDTSPKKRITEGRGIIQRVLGGMWSLVKTYKSLKNELTKDCPNCVHITTSGSLGLMRDKVILAILAKKKVNTVYHIHFGRVSEILKNGGWEDKYLRYNLKLADNIVVIDETTLTSLNNNGFGAKSVYVPNFINLKELPKVCREPNKIITFIGWVIPAKGITELVEAWQSIPLETIQDWKLDIIGPYNREYVDTLNIETNGTINFIGELEHKEALNKLNNSKVFVLPSHTEGFPNSVLEAMVLGKAIIATSVGAIPQMLSEGCGIVIKEKCVEELKLALVKVMTENVDTLGMKALKRVEEEYEISKVVEQYTKLWRKDNVV